MYYTLRGRGRNYWLLAVSLLFFAWSQPNYLWLILCSIAVNYLCGLSIGISFFTFQGLSYVIDVYRSTVPPQKNLIKLALYIVLFPQLIAGPIVRYTDIALELDNRQCTLADFEYGIVRFIIGLGKKAIIANTMAATADAIWGQACAQTTWAIAWLGCIAYTLQIYFDFSGYSDMAIGLGRMFGFHFNENFNLPYTSKSISEFWRRWHISLSSWFRDYVYIPLGGNRRRVYLNLAIVFLLTGIWHGASWHFVVWGVWNGCFILSERFLRSRNPALFEADNNLPKRFLLKAYTLLVVIFGWVLFRAEHTSDAFKYLCTMFGLYGGSIPGYRLSWFLDPETAFMLLAGVLFSTAIPTRLARSLKSHMPENLYLLGRDLLLLFVLFYAMLRIISGTYNPFIYFQF